MSLLLDYFQGGKEAKDIARDPLMAKANNQYLHEMQNIVGDHHAKQAVALMLGGLLMDY